MEQLMALGIEPGEQDSADKSLAALKSELVEEKAARAKAQTEVETLALAVEDLKKIADRFVTQIPTLEEKVKHLDNKVLDGPTELHAKELNLERTTKANEDYKSQNARLPHELESKLPSPVLPRYCILLNILLTPL
jgi:chromosome segregation ATPase